MTQVKILVGAQWGDEGKGKWVDIMADDIDLVARYQGGNNAGHTLYIEGEKIVLHQIPSGIFRPQVKAALTSGVVINPVQLVDELETARRFAEITPARLWLSPRAHVITPWHVLLDGSQETNAQNPIGTTKRGIGPTYTDKYARRGLRLGQYLDENKRQAWIDGMKHQHPEFASCLENQHDQWQAFGEAAATLAPFVIDAETRLRRELQRGSRLLLEGAQGALLDIDHGTYPYVTSSSTMSGGAMASLGFSPKLVDHVYGVAKAYLTRVGEGPFPTELFDDDGRRLAELGHEFGATTGRARRCGWLDGVALRYSYHANGLDSLILNKIDILSEFDRIKLCVAYEHPQLGRLEDFPWDLDVLSQCKPIYEEFTGWKSPLDPSVPYNQQPQQLKTYVNAVAKLIEGEVSYIGTGADRDGTLKVTV